MVVGMWEYKRVQTMNCGVRKLQWCATGLSHDLVIGMAYVMLSFYVALWRITLKHIPIFCYAAWLPYTILAGGMNEDVIV